jgi:type IV pilus assembly protein PilB
MAPLLKDSSETRIQTALLSFKQEDLSRIRKTLERSDLKDLVEFKEAKLPVNNNLKCDVAIALLKGGKKFQEFKSQVTSLKLIRKIPVVMAVFEDINSQSIESSKVEIAADEILCLPLDSRKLETSVKTRVVALRIAQKKQLSHVDFSSQSQALGEILVENKVITPLQLKKALDYQKENNIRLGDAMVALGYINENQKIQFLASQLTVPIATPKQYAAADIMTISLIPERLARQHHCIALEKEENVLTVAMVDILNLRLLDSLRDQTEHVIAPILGTVEDIDLAINKYYRDVASHADASSLIAELGDEMHYIKESDKEDIDLEEMAEAGAELGIIKLVNMLIYNAVRDKASDIHIEPMENALSIRYRIDGDLRRVMSPPKHSHQAIITRIKILADMDIAERRLPQDGRMVVKMGKREIDIRVSILPSVFGEKAVLRILDKDAFEKSVSNLGFTDADQDVFKEHIFKPYGMIVITGPTGSGKSTTLYSAISAIKNVAQNIVTAEDPVEFHMDGITQVNINNKIGLTFASVLRSTLRQDPDIVLIGEIRDEETADIAIKMALTGHLVFSTLHTNDASSAVARFVDIGVPPLLLGSCLNLIVAQRLVRKICPKCKVEYTPTEEVAASLDLMDKYPFNLYRGEGCVSCYGTGYSGRTGIFEMINVTKEVRKLIVKNAPTMDIQDRARKQGMKTLYQAGLDLALEGVTPIEQVLATTSAT